MSLIISASTNPPKEEELNEYIDKLNKTDVDYVHCDVMDGHFVSAYTFDYKKVKEIKSLTTKPLDVHLMIENPKKMYKKYIQAGANILTIHYECLKDKKSLIKVLQNIRKKGIFAGLSFKPDTKLEDVLQFIPFCDLLLVMSVEPGKSGQKFLNTTYERLDQINSYLKKNGYDLVVEVDGGVNDLNCKELESKNVNMIVVGNYLYSSKDLSKAVNKLKASNK